MKELGLDDSCFLEIQSLAFRVSSLRMQLIIFIPHKLKQNKLKYHICISFLTIELGTFTIVLSFFSTYQPTKLNSNFPDSYTFKTIQINVFFSKQ